MNIHEYQAKELLRSFGLPILNGKNLNKIDKFSEVIKSLEGPPWVIKSQIHAGGRGAGYFINTNKEKGGVRIVDNLEDAKKEVEFMLGNKLITKQTGPTGKIVNNIYIEEGCAIEKEFYLSLLIDRKYSKILLMTSSSGGSNIEDIAIKDPKKILSYHFDNLNKYNNEDLFVLANKLSFNTVQSNEFVSIINKLLKIFIELDLSTIEINPLVLNKKGSFILLDAKMVIDDNSLFRQSKVLKYKDETEEEPLELRAEKNKMNYVKLNGNIGCMVNGAGLAMATMDIIKIYGGEPANFLDLGGTANKDRVIEGFKIIQSDPKVKVILINIFGGIIRCDMIAEGIINAAKEINLKLTVVVRFQGTNASEGRNVIKQSSLNIIAVDSLSEAAKKQ